MRREGGGERQRVVEEAARATRRLFLGEFRERDAFVRILVLDGLGLLLSIEECRPESSRAAAAAAAARSVFLPSRLCAGRRHGRHVLRDELLLQHLSPIRRRQFGEEFLHDLPPLLSGEVAAHGHQTLHHLLRAVTEAADQLVEVDGHEVDVLVNDLVHQSQQAKLVLEQGGRQEGTALLRCILREELLQRLLVRLQTLEELSGDLRLHVRQLAQVLCHDGVEALDEHARKVGVATDPFLNTATAEQRKRELCEVSIKQESTAAAFMRCCV